MEQLLAGGAGAALAVATEPPDEVIGVADVGAAGRRANEDVDELHRG